MKPRVVIDARMLGFSGIGTYISNLLESLAGLDHEFEFHAICPRPELLPNSLWQRIGFIRGEAGIYGLREQWEVPRRTRGFDLLHCPHYNVPFAYRGPLVVTIHDLNHLLMPEYLRNRLAYYYASFMLHAACAHATQIITVSDYSKRCIQTRFGVSDAKIRLIYSGVRSRLDESATNGHPQRRQALGIRLPYVLYVGNLKPHKNIQGLLRAFASLSPERRRAFQLVITGKIEPFQLQLQQLARELAIEDRTVFTGYVSDRDLTALYIGAEVFVLPSFNEGFGFPVLEAMSFGIPVVASDRGSLPEVVGDAGILVDPCNAGSIAQGLQRVLNDVNLRSRLTELGKDRVKKFSYLKFAQGHLAVYREAMAG